MKKRKHRAAAPFSEADLEDGEIPPFEDATVRPRVPLLLPPPPRSRSRNSDVLREVLATTRPTRVTLLEEDFDAVEVPGDAGDQHRRFRFGTPTPPPLPPPPPPPPQSQLLLKETKERLEKLREQKERELAETRARLTALERLGNPQKTPPMSPSPQPLEPLAPSSSSSSSSPLARPQSPPKESVVETEEDSAEVVKERTRMAAVRKLLALSRSQLVERNADCARSLDVLRSKRFHRQSLADEYNAQREKLAALAKRRKLLVGELEEVQEKLAEALKAQEARRALERARKAKKEAEAEAEAARAAAEAAAAAEKAAAEEERARRQLLLRQRERQRAEMAGAAQPWIMHQLGPAIAELLDIVSPLFSIPNLVGVVQDSTLKGFVSGTGAAVLASSPVPKRATHVSAADTTDHFIAVCPFDLRGRCNDPSCPYRHLGPRSATQQQQQPTPPPQQQQQPSRSPSVSPLLTMEPSFAQQRRNAKKAFLLSRELQLVLSAPEETLAALKRAPTHRYWVKQEHPQLELPPQLVAFQEALSLYADGMPVEAGKCASAALEKHGTFEELWHLFLALYAQQRGVDMNAVRVGFTTALAKCGSPSLWHAYFSWCSENIAGEWTLDEYTSFAKAIFGRVLALPDREQTEVAFVLTDIVVQAAHALASSGRPQEACALFTNCIRAQDLSGLAVFSLATMFMGFLAHGVLPPTEGVAAFFRRSGSWLSVVDWVRPSIACIPPVFSSRPLSVDDTIAASRNTIALLGSMDCVSMDQLLSLIMGHALLLAHFGKDDLLSDLLQGLIADSENDPRAFMLAAAMRWNAGNFSDALRILESTEERSPGVHAVFLFHARLLVLRGTPEDAISVLCKHLGADTFDGELTVQEAVGAIWDTFSGDVHARASFPHEVMCYGLLGELVGFGASRVIDLFRSAATASQNEHVQKLLWIACARTAALQAPSLLGEIVDVALSRIPASVSLPCPISISQAASALPDRMLSEFSFANTMLGFYVSVLPASQHSAFLYRMSAETFPSNTDLAVLSANWEAHRHRNLPRALALTSSTASAAERSPHSAQLLIMHASILSTSGQLEDARETLLQAIMTCPHDRQVWRTLRDFEKKLTGKDGEWVEREARKRGVVL